MNEERIEYVPLDKIVTERQVRTEFPDDVVQDMATTIDLVGQLQPIRLRRRDDLFVVVEGELRVRAKRTLGDSTIAAIVEEQELSTAQIRQRQLIADCQRAGLTPLDTAYGIKEVIAETGWTAAEAAANLGFSPATVSKLLALAALPEAIQSQIREGKIPATAGYDLSRVADAAQRAAFAARIANGELTRDGLSGIVKRSRKPSAAKAGGLGRLRGELSGGRSITVVGAGLESLDILIEWLEELLGKARKLRPRGLTLTTFGRILREELKSA